MKTDANPQPFANIAILASAGTGKTYALAHRYIHLLGRGIPPDRICALTFSRKAAAEIFDSLVGYLVQAAQDPGKAAQTARDADLPDFQPADAVRLLARLVTRPQRVQIGTLDSFFVAVLRAFSSEIGLPPDFDLLDSQSAEARRLAEQALAGLLDPRAGEQARQAAFFDAFKAATFGREERGFNDNFFAFLDAGLALFRQTPDPAAWGAASAIWPAPPPWLTESPRDSEESLERVRAFLEHSGADPKAAAALLYPLEAAATALPFQAWNTTAFESTMMKRLFAGLPDLPRGLEVTYNRKKIDIPPAIGRDIRTILHRLVRHEAVRVLKQTEGLGRILAEYARLYDQTIRQSGTFTFTDAQYLLSPRNPAAPGALSRRPDQANRLYLDFRLDARLDHWLLDEFQDTSDLQWDTLDNLADEIIQDGSGTRSFFMVGDVKQAIHAWRGGNPRLFGEILDRYKQGRAFAEEKRSVSHRSAQPVLDAVNRVFDELAGSGLPDEAVTRWNRYWEAHRSSRPQLAGCAAWLEPAGGDEPPDEAAVYRAVAGVIRELRPAERALSLAVLLPTNRACAEAADALRRELRADGIPVANEGAAELADNPPVALMRALLRYAAHPGDSLARLHLLMSPLRDRLQDADGGLPARLLADLQTRGFAPFLREWERQLGDEVELDAYGRTCLADLQAVALAADQRGEREPDAFLAHLEALQLREQSSAPGAVRVMTIHQSKGLGFDAVLLPLLQNEGLATPGTLDLTAGTTAGRPWILKMPRALICEADPVLKARRDQAVADTAFENLCVFYVALTRARQGLYVFTRYGRKKRSGAGRSLSAGIFAAARLLGTHTPEELDGEPVVAGGVPVRRLHLHGAWNWAESRAPAPAAPARQPPPAAFAAAPSGRVRLKALEPSRGEEGDRRAAWLFNPESRAVLDFGVAIHELLALVEWSDSIDPNAVIARWKPAPDLAPAVRHDAVRQFRQALAAPEVRQALARPRGPAALWREKPFEWVDGEWWISGAFDRVTILFDEAGRPARAEILDFKSNRVESRADMQKAADRYRRQLSLYRRALAGLLGLAPDRIALRILFTRPAALFAADY